ncbi:MAG: hypothetical protein IPJ65_00190 [Archangiaceae bacterium]|nr:hypothetical protein [Archangiaceae bacterium]
MKNLLLAALCTAAACTAKIDDGGRAPPSISTTDTDVPPFDHGGLGGSSGGSGGGTGGGSGASSTSSGAQRLSVSQLRSSLPVVLGSDGAGAPVTWKIGTAVGFDARSATLGEADYLTRVDDDLEPSPLYLKFMFDMARDSCNRVIVADAARAQTARVLTRWAGATDTVASNKAAVDKNLRSLRLAFHGVKVADGDEAGIAPYRKLFDDAVKSSAGTGAIDAGDVTEGWRAVCVALLTAPEYHFY